MGKTKNFFQTNASAFLTIIVGLFLIIRPGSGIRLVSIVTGLIILASGIIDIIQSVKGDTKGNIAAGVIKLVFGIIILTHTGAMMTLLIYIFGVYILIGGIRGIAVAAHMKKSGIQGWPACMIVSVAISVAAIAMMLFPFRVLTTAVTFAGVILLINGILEVATKKQI